jgi:hypothetical protein
MLPEEQVKNIIKNNSIISLSASVQKFYNGPSCAIDFESAKQVDEIINLLQEKLTNKNTT